ncbi:MAG: ABC transporter substrate-binding protein [Thermodesulfobacteriota bacterium]
MGRKSPWLVLSLAALAVLILMAAPAAAAEPIVLGVPTSLGVLEGKESLNAVKLAVDEINAGGGVKVGGEARQLSVTEMDIRDASPGTPVPEALLGLEKMILEKKPHAIVVGPFRSEALLAGMDLIAKYKVPLLGTIAMTPASEKKIQEDPEKYKYVFRVSLNVTSWAGLLMGAMKDLQDKFGFTKVYLLNQDVLWARGTTGAMKGWFEKNGWEVLGHDQFPTGAGDFAPVLMKAKMGGAQVLFTCFDMPESGILVKQWKAQKVPALMAGFISPMAGEAAWGAFEGKIGGLLNAIFELGNIPSQKYPQATAFYEAYKKKFGKGIEAGHGPAPSYEAVYIFKEAVEKAGSLDPDALVKALQATDRQGVMGRAKFNPGNQVVFGQDPKDTATACIYQWGEKGGRTIVYPAALAEGDIKLPPWMKSAK